jgi:DNA-binding HxlR family transcriptional regulator
LPGSENAGKVYQLYSVVKRSVHTSLAPAIRLFHYRWSVPIVATLHRDGPRRFAELSHSLSASRDTLTDTLAKLEQSGAVTHEQGVPRPPYRLTPVGEHVGSECVAAVAAIAGTDVLPIALKKWPMLVAVAIGRGATRYNEMKALLPGITARALAIALKDLQAAALVHREVGHGYPPAAAYTLTEKGLAFLPVLDRLCIAAEEATRPG